MITVGTTVVSGSPINGGGGGAGLPVAAGAGEVPLSTGAGTTYAAANFGDEVGAAIAAGIGSTLGQAIIGDGAGDIAPTSADVSGFLAASDTAGMLSALSLSWTEIAAASFTHTAGTVTGGVASVVSERLHTELAGVISDDLSGGFLGPRHEIALPVDDGAAWSVAALVSFTGLDSGGRVSLSLRRTTVQILGATIRDSGNLETFSDVAAPTSTITAGFASGDWLRLTRRGGIMEVYTGTGASLAAIVWTWRSSIAVASGQLPLTLTVSMAQYSSGPSSPPLTSDAGPVYAKSGL
jgi:hypothetical protein